MRGLSGRHGEAVLSESLQVKRPIIQTSPWRFVPRAIGEIAACLSAFGGDDVGQRMRGGKQTSLRDQASVTGVGVHSGLPVTLTIHPADANSGILFVRSGMESEQDREVRANVAAVTATEFATVLGDAAGPLVSTAEHVLAALRGLGVDNAVVELDGPEVPIMDGSAAAFVAAIDQVGLRELDAPRRFIKVLKPVRVAKGDSLGELRPYAHGFRLEAEINFDHPLDRPPNPRSRYRSQQLPS